jgi:hypothetical protein
MDSTPFYHYLNKTSQPDGVPKILMDRHKIGSNSQPQIKIVFPLVKIWCLSWQIIVVKAIRRMPLVRSYRTFVWVEWDLLPYNVHQRLKKIMVRCKWRA